MAEINDECLESDYYVESFLSKYDDTNMILPSMEFKPHILISKVRKHYMEHIVKLLSVNYETNQKLVSKNIYLPSAIWRCAKYIETSAAQASMVVQIYRRNIITVVKDLRKDTLNGKLYKKLYECLRASPNDKKVQTDFSRNCSCECHCKYSKKQRKNSSRFSKDTNDNNQTNVENKLDEFENPSKYKIQTNQKYVAPQLGDEMQAKCESELQSELNLKKPNESIGKPSTKVSVEIKDSDELMLQLEKLFQGNNDDDLFDGTLCGAHDISSDKTSKQSSAIFEPTSVLPKENIIDNLTSQIQSLDERLVTFTGLLVNNETSFTSTHIEPEVTKNKRTGTKRWLCEEYFLKKQLFELLDQLREYDRSKLIMVKTKLINLFGEDSDNEGVISPIDENPDFVISCKERIAPWVVRILTPYYIRGHIRQKSVFKSLAKHLIRIIYQCSQYPEEHEVESFVKDFLESHETITCEADFKQFRIANIT